MLGIPTNSDIFRKFFWKTIDKTTLSWYNDDNETNHTNYESGGCRYEKVDNR